ncbi:MAG TPA: histidine phosphatase family protein [Ramlibacter sp.]|nr:histidine phosphatase family protein [Ramlibacter sp.]
MTIGAADVILIRHATAPGVGDPANVKVGDCTTQRNLSEQGRAEARKLGEEFRRRGVHIGKVLTSQWCRTRETARLAFPKEKSHDEPAFNSWFGQVPTESESQLKIARAILNGWKGPGVLVVVTHAVNISAVAAVKTAPAQAVVMRRDAGGSMRVVGTLVP